jgi:hypothetical protein
MPDSVKLTLVTESPVSFYSGMLPGTVSCKEKLLKILELYTDEDL